MAKNWHMDVTKGLVDAVNMIVDDYKTEKKITAKKEATAAKEKNNKKGKGRDEDEEDKDPSRFLPLPGQFKAEASGDKEAYQKFFRQALKKFGVSSPDELEDSKKKSFYDYVDKNWKGDNEKPEPEDKQTESKKSKKEGKNIKLSGKKEKIKINPAVTTEEGSLENIAMGMNPFQRAVQQKNTQSLNEAFQHTWGYVAQHNPHQYVDLLQVKTLYSVGSGPEEAAQRILGYQPEALQKSTFFRRQRRFDIGGAPTNPTTQPGIDGDPE